MLTTFLCSSRSSKKTAVLVDHVDGGRGEKKVVENDNVYGGRRHGRWWSWLEPKRWWNLPRDQPVGGIFYYLCPLPPALSEGSSSPAAGSTSPSSTAGSTWTCPWGAITFFLDDTISLTLGYMFLLMVLFVIPLYLVNVVINATFDAERDARRPPDDDMTWLEIIQERLEDGVRTFSRFCPILLIL